MVRAPPLTVCVHDHMSYTEIMFKFPSFKRTPTEPAQHERYNQKNVEAFQVSIIAGLNVPAFDDARNTAADHGETSCVIPFTSDEAGRHGENVLRALLSDKEAVWFKNNLQSWLTQTLRGVPQLHDDGRIFVNWDTAILDANPPNIPRTLGGDPMNGDET